MVRVLLIIALCCALTGVLAAHNIGVTPVTWNREISRLVYDKCASCHHPGGSAFSMVAYVDVQPRLVDIQREVQTRRMPPWGAVKGFGEFRNDQALTQEQIELIVDWIQNDAPRGNNHRALPAPPSFTPPVATPVPAHSRTISGRARLDHAVTLDGLLPEKVAPHQSIRITAVLPDGAVTPLIWLHQYEEKDKHSFIFRKSLVLPAGTTIEGVPSDARITLLAH